ncbi:MAG: hypothetical protein AMJ53_11315 [Gammaproteobacteria bacterium SG8_11]|nr:MAG: hypothetical protein AMJ53_11315 [Gammaproteobacteria bacterium SG8_11]
MVNKKVMYRSMDEALHNALSNLLDVYREYGASDDPDTILNFGIFTVGTEDGEVSVSVEEISSCMTHHNITIRGRVVNTQQDIAVTIDVCNGDTQVWDPTDDEGGHGHPVH